MKGIFIKEVHYILKEDYIYTYEDMIKLDNDENNIFIPLTKDYVIKNLFNRNPKIYKEFLLLQIKDIINLNKDNTSIIFNNVELGKSNYMEYNKIIDSYVILNDNIHIDFECNSSVFKEIKRRNILYMNKISTRVLESGDNTKKLKNIYIIQLNINTSKQDSTYGEDEIILFGKKTNKIFSKLEYIIVKNIEYYRNLFYNESVKLPKDKMWLVVLTSKTYQELYNTLGYVVNDKERNKILKDVIEMFSDGFLLCEWEKEKLDAIVALEREDDIKERATRKGFNKGYKDGIKKGIEDGIEQGIEQGIESNIIKTIKAMLNKNFDLKIISEITGKSIEEIKQIQKNN